MVSLCMSIYDIRDDIVKKQAVSSCNKSSGLPDTHLKVPNISMLLKLSALLEGENPSSLHEALKSCAKISNLFSDNFYFIMKKLLRKTYCSEEKSQNTKRSIKTVKENHLSSMSSFKEIKNIVGN